MSLLQRDRELIVSNEFVKEFDFEEIQEFVKGASKNLFISHKFKTNKGKTLVQPRGGFPTYDKMFALYKEFKSVDVDVLPMTIDSNTRLNDYLHASKMLKLSEEENKDLLNGYPLINHGYKKTREMTTHFDTPISLRHGTPDARLLVDMAIASGAFEIEGGPITYILPYSKNFPQDKAFLYWKHVERVTAEYSKLNEPINRESFGPLTATLVPPVITIVIQIAEMLLSLEEGVKSFSVSFAQTGSLNQDLVTSKVLRKSAAKYAEQIGCGDAKINLVYHQWMGAFPRDKYKSDSLIDMGAMSAGLVGADKIITKTRAEAFGIPTAQDNAQAVSNVKYILNTLRGIPNFVDQEEEENLTRQVDEVFEAIFNDKADTLWRKIFNSIKNGIIDVPFSPHIINNNELITVRDKQSNIRIYKKGKLPISEKSFRFEQSKLNLAENPDSVVNQIIKDIGVML
ncbi:MAG: methylaspartate mutase [Campylobacterota bacterium]|nr:methylaspartate mutase [Campylobacterota bacterium]